LIPPPSDHTYLRALLDGARSINLPDVARAVEQVVTNGEIDGYCRLDAIKLLASRQPERVEEYARDLLLDPQLNDYPQRAEVAEFVAQERIQSLRPLVAEMHERVSRTHDFAQHLLADKLKEILAAWDE